MVKYPCREAYLVYRMQRIGSVVAGIWCGILFTLAFYRRNEPCLEGLGAFGATASLLLTRQT